MVPSAVVVATSLMSSSLVLSAVQLLPERVGPLRETGSRAVSPNNPALFREIGFVYAEAADYQASGRKATLRPIG